MKIVSAWVPATADAASLKALRRSAIAGFTASGKTVSVITVSRRESHDTLLQTSMWRRSLPIDASFILGTGSASASAAAPCISASACGVGAAPAAMVSLSAARATDCTSGANVVHPRTCSRTPHWSATQPMWWTLARAVPRRIRGVLGGISPKQVAQHAALLDVCAAMRQVVSLASAAGPCSRGLLGPLSGGLLESWDSDTTGDNGRARR